MTFLDVPFREKDQAKSLGARWDAVSKKWYIPDSFDGEIELFQKWLPNSASNTQNSIDTNLNNQLNLSDSANDQEKGLKLSVVLHKVQTTLRQNFPGGLWVIAEIANINTRRGHVYLELTETNQQGQAIANCRAMIWQSQANRLLQRFETETGSQLAIGQKVLVLAELSFHEQYGFSLVVQDLDPSYTLGELEQKLNQIRQNLIKKGLYQQNKQQQLASDFFRIAVIAPPQAAGLGDFRADADRLQKNQLCEFKYFYSSFQGEAVESEMLAALEAMQALHQTKPFDALVIIRGGGAKLDLNMLNIETIAEQLCLLKLPVLSGIGHERDNTIIDEVAHTRFDTPSKVIGYIAGQIIQQAKQAQADWLAIEKSSRLRIQNLQQQISRLNHSITQNSLSCVYRWQKRIEPAHHQITRLSQSRIASVSHSIDVAQQNIQANVKQKLERASIEVDQLKNAIEDGAKRSIEIQKQQIIQSIAFILSSGPKTQLNRGFSLVKDSDGKPLTTAEQAVKNKEIELEFADGSIMAKVDTSQQIKKEK